MHTILAAIVVVLMAGAAQAQAPGGCQYQGAYANPGDRFVSTRLQVPQNGRCSHAVGGAFGNVQVVTQPQHGRAEATAGGITYTPNPGFTGADAYAFSARGTSGPVQVTVNVDVR